MMQIFLCMSVFIIYVVKTKAQSVIMSCVLSGVYVISWNALDVLGTELYPTQLRWTPILICNKVILVLILNADRSDNQNRHNFTLLVKRKIAEKLKIQFESLE